MESRNVRRTCVDKLAIHLIREQIKVIFLHQIADLIHLLAGIQIAGRVVRITDKYSLRALSDQLLELLHRRKGKTGLDGRRNGLDHSTRRHSKGHIIGICRLRDDDFITRIQARKKCKKHRLRTTRSHNDVIRRKFDAILRIILCKLLAKTQKSLTRAVLQHLAVHMTHSIQSRLRSRKVRLTDIQMIHLDAACLCIVGKRSKLTYR